MPGEQESLLLSLEIVLCVALYCIIVWNREWFSSLLSSWISYSAAIWSLPALLQCTKPYCVFFEISRDGESEKEKGREGGRERVKDSSGGAKPISPISSREHAGIPKDTDAKILIALLPTSRRRRRGDLCHGNPIPFPSELPVAPDCLGEWRRVWDWWETQRGVIVFEQRCTKSHDYMSVHLV